VTAISDAEAAIRDRKAALRAAVRARKLDTALAAAKDVLAMVEAHFGARHPTVASAVNDLGLVLKLRGDNAAALEQYERAVRLYEALLGREHVNTATATAK
jgi:tetratricopeptide (TPR) repeat protein